MRFGRRDVARILRRIGGLTHPRAGTARIQTVEADFARVLVLVGENLHQPFHGELRGGIGAPVSPALAADAG